MSYIARAIYALNPGSEFSLTDDDLDTLHFDVLIGSFPTKKAIVDKADEIKTQELEAAESAKSKLQALGFTDSELRSLGL